MRRLRLGEALIDIGSITPDQLARALALQATEAARLGEILRLRGLVTDAEIARALAHQSGLELVDLERVAPDPSIVALADPVAAARLQAIPVTREGDTLVVAAAHADVTGLPGTLGLPPGPFRLAIAPQDQIERALHRHFGAALARRAAEAVPEALSCRGFGVPGKRMVAVWPLGLALLAVLAWPATIFTALFAAAAVLAFASAALRLVSLLGMLRGPGPGPGTTTEDAGRRPLPVISVLVPLFREGDILPSLIGRLGALDYPPELADVCLVVEAVDTATLDALRAAVLPRNFRVIVVPDGLPRTKPRALNYALNFCRGEIIGIYDAEDAPEPAQLRKVAAAFAAGPARLGCVQGRLGFYNASRNWLTRCFALEYATWFGIVLTGLSRLGLALPLGGTTCFIRRDALEAVGAWDAHNVTEDADLGLRLARKGWQTRVLDIHTGEEAVADPVTWVRQRSRWLKGLAMTWAVLMRRPFATWQELGTGSFLAAQVMTLGAFAAFLLAPVLWSYWLQLVPGLSHPAAALLPPAGQRALALGFVSAEMLNLALALAAARRSRQARLAPWAITLPFYFALATLAAFKAAVELAVAPFFWDKTPHGRFGGVLRQPAAPAQPPRQGTG